MGTADQTVVSSKKNWAQKQSSPDEWVIVAWMTVICRRLVARRKRLSYRVAVSLQAKRMKRESVSHFR